MALAIERFVEAQSAVYADVLAELTQGRKRTHWMWFVFPQLAGLGSSSTARHYGITGADEAKEYLRHPILGPRLRESTALVNAIEGSTVDQIFGYPDNLKFRSCMTLFLRVSTDSEPFERALAKYFGSKPDTATLDLLYRARPLQRHFEAAAAAIAAGDIDALRQLLTEHPALIGERSMREHRATLLHYVAANGVEGSRQKTPPNILDITRLLLNAGADVNAFSDAYGGHSTTLAMAATSCHPEDAGLQIPLLELLLERGAALEPVEASGIVLSCLHNGRGQAATFLANKGAHLDFEAAAGVGRLDLVRAAFEGALTEHQKADAFLLACQFGHGAVVEFLLDHGQDIAAKGKPHGQTGLHWAAHGGHPDLTRLLLERGAPVNTRDESFRGTPIEWALHAWKYSSGNRPWHQVVAQLARAGDSYDPQWFQANEDRQSAFGKLRSDPAMQAALRGEG